jgi:opacity protein-like surface antigen
MKVVALMANTKKYFEKTGLLYPYVGAGLGFADTSFSGDLTGSASSSAYQAMAGIEFRSKNIGLYADLKYLYLEHGRFEWRENKGWPKRHDPRSRRQFRFLMTRLYPSHRSVVIN